MKPSFQPLKSVLNLRSGIPSRDLKGREVQDAEATAPAQLVTPSCLLDGVFRPDLAAAVRLSVGVIGRHSLHNKDVVVSSRGEFLAGMVGGDAGLQPGAPPFVAGPLCHVLSHAPWSPVLPEFIVWLLGTEYSKQQMAAEARGSATSLYSLETVGNLQVPILTMERQKAIAEAAKAGQVLREARLAHAETETQAHNHDLCRLAGLKV
jgi:hypothetical protein